MDSCPDNYTVGKDNKHKYIEYDNINDTNKIRDLISYKNYIEITNRITSDTILKLINWILIKYLIVQ